MLPGVRPVPLEIVIQSFDIANLEARTSAMARPAYTAVSNTLKEAATPADAKSAILFVPTRKQARLTALDLLTYAAADGEPNRFLQARHATLCSPHAVTCSEVPDVTAAAARQPPPGLMQDQDASLGVQFKPQPAGSALCEEGQV